MTSTNKMRAFYFSMLWELAIAYNLNKEDLHEMFKVWYKIKSTAKLTYNEWFEYIENVIYFIACIFDALFDSEGYKIDGISSVWLQGTMKPDNYKTLF